MTRKWADGSRALGKFDLPSQEQVYGELALEGYDSKLVLHDVKQEYYPGSTSSTVHGVVDHTVKLSLFDCILLSSQRSADAKGKVSDHRLEIFPHHILFGDSHVAEGDAIFTSIMFKFTDSINLFYDFDTFGIVLHRADSFIEPILAAKSEIGDRKIPVGEHPAIAYFTGKHTIVRVPTDLGVISAQNLPTTSIGGPHGSGFVNSIWVEVEFSSARTFNDALEATFALEPFFSMVAGRPQRFEEMRLLARTPVEPEAHSLKVFEVFSSMKQHLRFPLGRAPHPADVPIDPVRRPEEFSRVLVDWVNRVPAWRDARERYSNSLRKQDLLDIDRLVGSANMFDILPSSAVPEDVELSDELKVARDQSRELFRKLPDSPERSSILLELKRLGKSNLKNKVRYRAAPIVAAVGDKFPDLLWVLDEAVNCRNHYVHGALVSKVDYSAHFHDLGGFFTKSLEFVFAASDMVEAGWDIKAWASRSSTLSHPFFDYRHSYKEHLDVAKTLLGKKG
ncbi:HEPN domain-containing protein [Mesorhizobium sp. B1-1-8]|uniref:ApeA N-terminal domain 1-containing protein n=1 Tax=Mesorhizobium sp. B1-1-8 TaxID=2589976 RepID=UPI001125DF50|nr:HEPN domain-containing protein [Mesorhizobium sp. B1-1-8]UCI08696.1 hypothetical protein FJ974_06395 [Mesorhizobium sp. B1-1-8]